MIEQTSLEPDATSNQDQELTNKEQKYGKSIFKKWIYAKFDAKLILEVVQKDIYYNPKLAILTPTINANGKKTFLSATLDLKGLQSLHKEVTEAITLLESHIKVKKDIAQDQV